MNPNTTVTIPPTPKRDIASAQKKGRPRKDPEAKIEVKRLNIELPNPVFERVRLHAESLHWTQKAVILDCLYVYFYGARRASPAPVGEEVFCDMAQLVRLFLCEEKRLGEAMAALKNGETDTSFVVLETVLAEIKEEFRAVRRQMAMHLSALPQPSKRNPGAGAKPGPTA